MSKGEWIRRTGNKLLDLVYPMNLYCISCGKITDDSRTYRLCNECMEASNWVTERRCAKCGKPLAYSDPGEKCFACSMEADRSFDRGHACAGYGAVEQSLIFAFKYGSRSDIGGTLGEIMHDRMAAEYGEDALAGMYDLVVPVPIHRSKKKKRGFNHADLMAESFAKRAGIACDTGMVMRTRDTAPMKGLGAEERRLNISGAFELRERRHPLIEGRSILLIDDIYTTGSTIDEIASLLKAAGASRVDFLAYAGGADMIVS
ncbi:MAG: ComF family protein [Mogibacterium sp.]|nr:ComF family protein [Mogibacterium sp.]